MVCAAALVFCTARRPTGALAEPAPSEPTALTSTAPAAPTPMPLATAAAGGPAAPAPPAPPAPTHATAAPAPAADKPPSFELRDRGDAVEVIAHNIKAARTAIIPVRSRLDVPIVAGPSAKRVLPGDPTVKLIELDAEDSIRVLSVKLGFERADVKALSRFVQAIQVGDDLHVIVPRKLPVDGTVPRLPDPTLPAAVAAAADRLDHPAAAAHKPADAAPAKPEAHDARPAAATSEPPATPAAAPPVAAAPAAPAAAAITAPAHAAPAKPADDRSLKQALAAPTDDAWSRITTYAALGLAAVGGGIWLMRRRRAQLVPAASIEVIAQRSLGGKARILWLSAGERELMVSVTPQQVRLLGQWRKTEATQPAFSALPAAQTYGVRPPRLGSNVDAAELADAPDATDLADVLAPPAPEPIAAPDKPVSPAVSGILRLRARTEQFAAVDPRVAGPRTGQLAVQIPALERPRPRTGQIPIADVIAAGRRTGQMAVADSVATGDVEADDVWAKELLAATRRS